MCLIWLALFLVAPKNMVIEQVRSYGMPVGATVFDTVFWSGRFCQAWPNEFHQMPRLKVKQHICHDSRAKDSNIIQALVDRFAYGVRNKGKGNPKPEPGFFLWVQERYLAGVCFGCNLARSKLWLNMPLDFLRCHRINF